MIILKLVVIILACCAISFFSGGLAIVVGVLLGYFCK